MHGRHMGHMLQIGDSKNIDPGKFVGKGFSSRSRKDRIARHVDNLSMQAQESHLVPTLDAQPEGRKVRPLALLGIPRKRQA
jgi:hypothetical protein